MHWSYCHGHDKVPLLFTVPLMWVGDSRSPISWRLLMSPLSLASFLVRQPQIWTTECSFTINTDFQVYGFPLYMKIVKMVFKPLLSLWWDSMCWYHIIFVLRLATVGHNNFYPRPVLAFGYCRCLRLSVCVSMCVHQRLGCPCNNSSPVQARITKFGP